VIYLGVHYYERYRQAEMEKLQLAVVATEGQLQGLVSQINPHFIFNCLNSLRALILEDPPRAQNMVTQLAALLRYSLRSGKTFTVPLGEEIDIVNTYLQLEAIRFEERLAIRMEMAPETLSVQVPPMLLQSLVENGVKHGIEKLTQGGEISVASRMDHDTLKIEIMNSGRLLDGSSSTQIGLINVRERLFLLYGSTAALVLRNQGTDSVLAEISIPVKRNAVR
jgi:LytS/YehU family sensor histidine kinase